jgi:hypothetical protein
MLVTLIASACPRENNYCPSSAHAVYPAACADRGIAGAAGWQRYSRHQRVFTFSGNCKGQRLGGCHSRGTPLSPAITAAAKSRGFSGVYETGVEGIGIALQNSAGQRVGGIGSDCDTRAQALGYISSDASMTFGYTVTLTLVKTGDTATSGTLDVAQTKFGMGVYDTVWASAVRGSKLYR